MLPNVRSSDCAIPELPRARFAEIIKCTDPDHRLQSLRAGTRDTVKEIGSDAKRAPFPAPRAMSFQCYVP